MNGTTSTAVVKLVYNGKDGFTNTPKVSLRFFLQEEKKESWKITRGEKLSS
jgi:hypothetical protein